MSVLGIYDGHNAGAALIGSDGSVLAAVEEERFSRIKNHDSRPGQQEGPIESIRYCLGQSPEQVSQVVFGILSPENLQTRALDNFDNRIASGQTQRLGRASEIGISAEQLRKMPYTSQLRRAERLIEDLSAAGVPRNTPVAFVDHHEAHAAGAFYLSPAPEALILTLDGKGDDLSGTISIGRESEINRLLTMPTEESLGHLYSAFTVACGLRPQRDEGKLQALAASGALNDGVWTWLERTFQVDKVSGALIGGLNDGLVIGPYPDRMPNLHNDLVAKIIAGVKREDVANTVQTFLEKIVSELALWHMRASGQKTLVVAGGVFANVSLNRHLARLPEVNELHVHPAMTDSGVALGAAASWFAGLGERPKLLTSASLGPAYDDKTASQAFERSGFSIVDPAVFDASAEDVLADALARGEFVARFVGRAEYGPRALGNRSILAPANRREIPEQLNARLHRSNIMPFAPITRAEVAARSFEDMDGLHGPLRFMTSAVQCAVAIKKRYPAAVHSDGTARPQVVDSGPLYDLLGRYEELTGNQMLINTSFNLHDEPMVCRPDDAARTARAADIRTIQVGSLIAVQS